MSKEDHEVEQAAHAGSQVGVVEEDTDQEAGREGVGCVEGGGGKVWGVWREGEGRCVWCEEGGEVSDEGEVHTAHPMIAMVICNDQPVCNHRHGIHEEIEHHQPPIGVDQNVPSLQQESDAGNREQ